MQRSFYTIIVVLVVTMFIDARDRGFSDCVVSEEYSMMKEKCWKANRTAPVEVFRNKWFHFIGDSVTRLAFVEFYRLLSNSSQEMDWNHTQEHFVARTSTRITFQWARYFNETIQQLQAIGSGPDACFLQDGLHQVFTLPTKSEFFVKILGNGLEIFRQNKTAPFVIFQTAPPVNRTNMKPKHYNATWYSSENIRQLNQMVVSELKHKVVLLDGFWNFQITDQLDGVHSIAHAKATSHRLAWLLVWKDYGESRGWIRGNYIARYMATQRIVMTVCVFVSFLWSLSAISVYFFKQTKVKWIEKVLFHLCSCLLVATYVVISSHKVSIDVQPPNALVLAPFIVALAGLTQKLTVLPTRQLIGNRLQTEEWKGWMQLLLLCNLSLKWSYCFESCYLYITGFGHFVYLYNKNAFTFERLCRMLFRINFLVGLLLLADPNRNYWNYIVCPLHSLAFLIVWCTMLLHYQHNTTPLFMQRKLAGLLVLIAMLCLVQFKCVILFPVWLGMATASYLVSQQDQILIRPSYVLISILFLALWIGSDDTYYTLTSFFTILPALVLRNSLQVLQQHHSWLLTWIGRHSLELYCLHRSIVNQGTLLQYGILCLAALVAKKGTTGLCTMNK